MSKLAKRVLITAVVTVVAVQLRKFLDAKLPETPKRKRS